MQIFSLLMQLFMGHIVSSLHLLKESIFFFVCILNLVFKFDLCVFFPHLLNFPENCFSQILLCFSYFYKGRSLFLTFVLHRGSCLRSMLTFFLQSGLEVNHSYEKTLTENAKGNLHSKAMYASSKQNVNHSQAQMCLNSEGNRNRARNSQNRGGGGRFI